MHKYYSSQNCSYGNCIRDSVVLNEILPCNLQNTFSRIKSLESQVTTNKMLHYKQLIVYSFKINDTY